MSKVVVGADGNLVEAPINVAAIPGPSSDESQAGDVTGHLGDGSGIDYWDGLEDLSEGIALTTMERVAALVKSAETLSGEIDTLSVELAEKEEARKKIVRVQLPEIMSELGMAEVKMESGAVVSILDKVNASISEVNRPEAFKWLEEHEYDGIIKTKVLAEFGKGEMEDAKKAQKALQDAGFMGSLDRNVHPMTLTSFVKERLAAGESLPESFSVFEFKEAKIATPKAKKPKKK